MDHLDTKIILFKADGKFEMFSRADDQKILHILKEMDKQEMDKTEIAIFIRPEGDYRKFLLYPDGRYQDMTGKQISSLEADEQVLKLEGYQVIDAEQYDLRGCEVETYSDGKKGIVKARGAMAYGIKYQIEKADGSVFTAFDSDLEVIRRPEQSVKDRGRPKKKPQREMER